MSDHFEMLVDVDATEEDAERVSRIVIDRLRKDGLIAGPADEDCVLGGTGYRPGPAFPDAYALGKREHPFWTLATCGVEPRVGRAYNEWAFGPSCEGLVCPACRTEFEPFDEVLDEVVGAALSEWTDRSGPAEVACPECRTLRSVTAWECRPPFGFGCVSFLFWNWAPFDLPAWRVDVPRLVQEATGHSLVRTRGHI